MAEEFDDKKKEHRKRHSGNYVFLFCICTIIIYYAILTCKINDVNVHFKDSRYDY